MPSSSNESSPPSPLPRVVDSSSTQAPAPKRYDSSSSSGSSSGSEGADSKSSHRLARPKLGGRMTSGTLIIPRDSPQVELRDEEYDEDDARRMSPRRSSEEIERMGQVAREALIEQAKALQASLLEIVDRVETVRSEHEKLEGGNRFLQSYIGELMQTSKITSTSAAKKGKK